MSLPLIALILAMVADIATTVVALSHPRFREANRFLAPLMARYGVLPTLVVTKVVALIPALVLGVFFPSLAWVAWIPAAITAYVAANNLRLILRSRL